MCRNAIIYSVLFVDFYFFIFFFLNIYFKYTNTLHNIILRAAYTLDYSSSDSFTVHTAHEHIFIRKKYPNRFNYNKKNTGIRLIKLYNITICIQTMVSKRYLLRLFPPRIAALYRRILYN